MLSAGRKTNQLLYVQSRDRHSKIPAPKMTPEVMPRFTVRDTNSYKPLWRDFSLPGAHPPVTGLPPENIDCLSLLHILPVTVPHASQTLKCLWIIWEFAKIHCHWHVRGEDLPHFSNKLQDERLTTQVNSRISRETFQALTAWVPPWTNRIRIYGGKAWEPKL